MQIKDRVFIVTGASSDASHRGHDAVFAKLGVKDGSFWRLWER